MTFTIVDLRFTISDFKDGRTTGPPCRQSSIGNRQSSIVNAVREE
jgi:hypothetical protein